VTDAHLTPDQLRSLADFLHNRGAVLEALSWCADDANFGARHPIEFPKGTLAIAHVVLSDGDVDVYALTKRGWQEVSS
jgi:hypothetical protein